MMCRLEARERFIASLTSALRDCVRRALLVRRAPLYAAAVVTGIASVSPIAVGAAFGPVFPLASLYPAGGGDGSRGFVLLGINRDDRSGSSVSAAGDVNGDGVDDLIIGAKHASYGRSLIGESYVVFGSTQGFSAILSLARLFPAGSGDGSQGFVLTGIDEGDGSGNSVSAAGDVDGDGIDDLIVGAYSADPNGRQIAGESYVVFGSTQVFPAVFPLETLDPAFGGDGSRGFLLTGIDADDRSGFSVSGAGDVNGDGIDDLIIGATGADPPFEDRGGESYVVFGSMQGFPAVFPLESLTPDGGGDGSRGFVFTGAHDADQAGNSVSAAGDINGDGIDDVIIGAQFANQPGQSGEGEAYVVFGSTQAFPAIFPAESLYPAEGGDGSRGFVLVGIDANDSLGQSVSGAGDLNGDGVDDLIVGATGGDPGGHTTAGESYVVFGSAQGFRALFAPVSLYPAGGGDGSRGFVLAGARSGDTSGASVSPAGDVNADGIDDVIVGAPGARSSAGDSYVVFGSTQSFPAIVPLRTLYPGLGGDGTRGFVLMGVDADDDSGRWVSDAGDLNGDGIDDVVIAAPYAEPDELFHAARPERRRDDAGESYVVFGRAAAP
jgi:hypothetical protein